MGNPQDNETRATLADAAALILADATTAVGGEHGTRLQELLSSMIARRAGLKEYVHLVHALHAVAVMAVAAELRDVIEKDAEVGPSVSSLVRIREKVRDAR